MNILFIHQNFPGQYKHLAPLLAADPSHRVVAMHMKAGLPPLPGITALCSTASRGNTTGIHPWLLETESKVIRGEANWRTAGKLRDEGFVPDVICAHPGWGETLFVKEVWPEARLIADDRLAEAAYTAPAGPIAPLDILYGHRPSLAAGNLYMAHRCGFTLKVLLATLQAAGFAAAAGQKRAASFDLWAVAVKRPLPEADLRALAGRHFP
jgi:hypothetical protein